MDKKFLIAVVLIFVVLFFWPLLFRKRQVQPPTPAETPKEIQNVEQPINPPKPPEPAPRVSPDTIVSIQTPLYDLQLTTDGARVVSWKLKDYKRRSRNEDLQSEDMDLIPQDIFADTPRNWLGIESNDSAVNAELEKAQWLVNKQALNLSDTGNEEESLEFSYSLSNGVVISKRMTFHRDSYVVDMDIGFSNPSSEEIQMGGYSLLWGSSIAKDEMLTDAEVSTEGPMVLINTEGREKLIKHWKATGFACFKGKNVREPEREGPISWVAFSSKYFVAAIIPGPDPWWSDPTMAGKRYKLVTTSPETALSPRDLWLKWGRTSTIGLVHPGFAIPSGQNFSNAFRVYAGPEKWDILNTVKNLDELGTNANLGKMINFGMFSPLGKATLWLLNIFHSFSRNYGISIIFLTILINIMFYPVTQRSFKSTRKMQALQPKITELKEKFRDDPQRLQKETLKLYKQFGVNPMGGCLPLLIQMPVFWALFTTLRGAVELRSAVFIPGWVYDLSLPDTIARIGNFPINILPILMTGTMLVQQLFFGTGTSGTGQSSSNKMMAFMPLIFAFIFYSMPSGLVLYWLCNNVLSIGRQYLMGKNKDENMEIQEKLDDKKNQKKLNRSKNGK